MQSSALEVEMNQVGVVFDEVHEAVHCFNVFFSEWNFSYSVFDLFWGQVSVVLLVEQLIECQ